MDCPKCKGLMMLERFSDFFLIFYAWKCINCGAIVDKTIANNRRKSLEESSHGASGAYRRFTVRRSETKSTARSNFGCCRHGSRSERGAWLSADRLQANKAKSEPASPYCWSMIMPWFVKGSGQSWKVSRISISSEKPATATRH